MKPAYLKKLALTEALELGCYLDDNGNPDDDQIRETLEGVLYLIDEFGPAKALEFVREMLYMQTEYLKYIKEYIRTMVTDDWLPFESWADKYYSSQPCTNKSDI